MLFKLVKFYNGMEGTGLHFAITESGAIFMFEDRKIEALKWNEKDQPLPEDWTSLTQAQWVLLHFPISLEFHWGDEPPEAPAVTPPRVLTEQEQALDAKYQQDLKWWKRARNERIAKSLDAAADIDSPFVTRETTEVTTEYSSPLCTKLLAAFIDGDETPEDPIVWRRKAAADSKLDYMQAIIASATQFSSAILEKKFGKDEEKPEEEKKS